VDLKVEKESNPVERELKHKRNMKIVLWLGSLKREPVYADNLQLSPSSINNQNGRTTLMIERWLHSSVKFVQNHCLLTRDVGAI